MNGPILVTGAGGLLGRALLARLDASSRVQALVRERPPQALPGRVEPIVHDLCSRRDPELRELPSTIVHLAQSVSYREFPERAIDVFEVNVGSTQRLLDWARRRGVVRFIYASSGAVYGHRDATFDEDAPAAGAAEHGYLAASKRCGELLAEAYCEHMTVIVLRFFFVYGPGQRRTMLIPRLIDQVRDRRPILLHGEDGARTNPVYVEDAAAAVEAAAALQVSGTINVAGPRVLSLREIATLIGDITGHPPLFQVDRDARPRHLVGGIGRMTRVLGPPRVDLADGLQRMLAVDHMEAAEGRAT